MDRRVFLWRGRSRLRYRAAMLVARTRADLRHILADLPGRHFVPTMGALHAGHLALVQAARHAGPVVVSIFVNPTQFAANEDFSRYPRDEAADLALLRAAGAEAAFLPNVPDIYPPGDATRIVMGPPADLWEGARRPGHFDGVATVVARLLALVQPHTAWFGEKDWQQLQVVHRLVTDLGLPVQIGSLPTVRDADGLALSSRNRYLTTNQRAAAAALPRLCQNAAHRMAAGLPAASALAEAEAALTAAGFAVDYLALADPHSLRPLDAPPGRLLVAARLGAVRLLDNFPVAAEGGV